MSTSGGGRPQISKHDVGWSIVTRENPKTVIVAVDWNVGTRSYAVADAEVQGHRTAADVAASAEAVAS